MSEDYDVIIVGGGPAGLSAAKAASIRGRKVLLLELQAQIGGQTQSAAWAHSEPLDDKLRRSEVNSVQKVTLHSPHHKVEVEGNFGSVIDRRTFDKILALEAAENGAEIWVGCPVKKFLMERGEVTGVCTEAGEWSEEIRGKVVIDASGARGKLSSLFLREIRGENLNREEMSRTNEYLMANVRGNGNVDLYFSSYFAPLGHAWIYPFAEGFAIAGIQGVRIHPDAALDEFIGRNKPPRLENSTPIAAFRGELPIGGPLKSTCGNGALAVGTAAGQIYPLSGFGLKYAVDAGKIAGKIAVKAIEEGDVSKERLMDYEQMWKNSFGKTLKAGSLLQESLQTSPDRKMDALLRAISVSPELQGKFINVFSALELQKNLEKLFEEEKIRRIFGRETSDKILSL